MHCLECRSYSQKQSNLRNLFKPNIFILAISNKPMPAQVIDSHKSLVGSMNLFFLSYKNFQEINEQMKDLQKAVAGYIKYINDYIVSAGKPTDIQQRKKLSALLLSLTKECKKYISSGSIYNKTLNLEKLAGYLPEVENFKKEQQVLTSLLAINEDILEDLNSILLGMVTANIGFKEIKEAL